MLSTLVLLGAAISVPPLISSLPAIAAAIAVPPLLSSLPLFATAITAPPVIATSTVQTSDLALSTRAGQRALDRRLSMAVGEVCGTASDADIAAKNDVRRCRVEALANVAIHRDQQIAAAIAEPPPTLNDESIVAELDRTFQLAVKQNDAAMMDRILHSNYKLVLGDGRVVNRKELLEESRSGHIHYEIQDEEPGSQSVIVDGDTAVVTAKLRLKGNREGKPFDRLLWFSDTYVRTPAGWRYFFGQASLPMPQS
jgi:UrcA family protein